MDIQDGSNVVVPESKLIAKQHRAGNHYSLLDEANDKANEADFYGRHAQVVEQHYADVKAGKLPAVDKNVVKTNPETGQPFTVEEIQKKHHDVWKEAMNLGSEAVRVMGNCPDCVKEHEDRLKSEHESGLHHEDADGPDEECSSCIEEENAPAPNNVVSLSAAKVKKNDDRTFRTVEDFRNNPE